MMPITYTQIIANKRYELKKAAANMEYMGSLALHDMKGMRETVMSLVLLSEMEAAASTAGTEQPNPDIIGTTHLPERPTRDMGPSRIAATEERYPDSSRRESRKNKVAITGMKERTLPTPAQMPSMSSEVSSGGASRRERMVERASAAPSTQNDSMFSRSLPAVLKVI